MKARLLLTGMVCAAFPSAALAQAPTKAELRDKSFEAAQWAMIGDAAAALTRVAAGFARGNGEVAALERKREELTQQRDHAERRYLGLARTNVTAAAEELQSLSRIEAELSAIGRQIEAADPGYAELTRPKALSVDEVRRLLNPDEALLVVLANDDASYTFAVTREGISWSRAGDLPAAALRDKVNTLRGQLAVDQARGLERADGPATAFDRALAYDLYRQLIGPVEGALAGKSTLLTVTDGPLAGLPLQVLPTAAPQGSAADASALRDTPWLVDKYAVATLPAVSSLHALRCLLVVRSERHSGCRGTASSARSARAPAQVVFAGFGAPALAGAPADARSAPPGFEGVFNGSLADPAKLRKLASLPGSKAELVALSDQFGAARSELKTGAEATETAVKESRAMQDARFVVYSTHGLLSAESGQVGEPGLVFTPPADNAASATDDGLLTASEAAKLQLAADMVVLSACNTAAPAGGDAAEGLSGLARAFLFAGARSLLVSHWPVDDAATSQLMVETFKGLERGSANRMQAFRGAVQALRADPRFASPAYWAPFTFVGAP